jgi:hypothetical protein
VLRVAFGHVKTLGLRNQLISKLYQYFRERGLPYGLVIVDGDVTTPHL